MQFFFDSEVGQPGTAFNATPSYLEIVTGSSEPRGTSFLYLLAGPLPHSVIVAACWGHDLDVWLPLLNDAKRGGDWIRAFSATYPTIGKLWDAAAAEDLGSVALVRDVDPDDMRTKWFARVCVGNVSLPDEVTEASVEEFLRSPRIVAAYRSVLGDSFTAAHEIATRKMSAPDKAWMLGKELYRSQIEAIDTMNRWAPRLKLLFGA